MSLPKFVAFKSLDNGRYLSARSYSNDDHIYLQFASDDKGDQTVGNEVFKLKDGWVRLKNIKFGKYWRRSSNNWVLVDADDSTVDDRETWFSIHSVEKNNIGLHTGAGDDNYCERHTDTAEGKIDCLKASAATLSPSACLVYEEFVPQTKQENL